LGLLIFNPYRGWCLHRPFPQVAGAIISLRSLLRFIFNPFGVGPLARAVPQVSPGATHIQPLWGWGLHRLFPQVSLGATHIQPLSGLGPLARPVPQVSPGAIQIQPLWGCRWLKCFPRFHLGLLIFNPFGVAVGSNVSPGCTWGYSNSTPLGLGPSSALPQVSPGAIHIQPLRGWGLLHGPFPRLLGLFIFNPFGVAVGSNVSPGCTWGYSYSTPTGLGPLARAVPQVAPGANQIQPLSGLGPSSAVPQVAPGAIISLRSLLRFNPYLGLGPHRHTEQN
jgi:hypothetical protein